MAKKEGPCWENYEMVGMKTKNGRKVPNCVPKKAKEGKMINQVTNFSCGGMGHAIRGGKFEGVR